MIYLWKIRYIDDHVRVSSLGNQYISQIATEILKKSNEQETILNQLKKGLCAGYAFFMIHHLKQGLTVRQIITSIDINKNLIIAYQIQEIQSSFSNRLCHFKEMAERVAFEVNGRLRSKFTSLTTKKDGIWMFRLYDRNNKKGHSIVLHKNMGAVWLIDGRNGAFKLQNRNNLSVFFLFYLSLNYRWSLQSRSWWVVDFYQA